MLKSFAVLGALVTVLTLSTSVGGQSNASALTDQITYNRLLTQVNQLDHQYAAEMQNAMSIARQHGGEPDLETKARLLSIRDQRDRIMSRLTLLALRHGWDLPYGGSNGKSTAATPPPVPHQEVFEAADHLIRARFKQEAARIARTVDLPMVARPSRFGDP